jgi:hypothetical protein
MIDYKKLIIEGKFKIGNFYLPTVKKHKLLSLNQFNIFE